MLHKIYILDYARKMKESRDIDLENCDTRFLMSSKHTVQFACNSNNGLDYFPGIQITYEDIDGNGPFLSIELTSYAARETSVAQEEDLYAFYLAMYNYKGVTAGISNLIYEKFTDDFEIQISEQEGCQFMSWIISIESPVINRSDNVLAILIKFIIKLHNLELERLTKQFELMHTII